MATALGSKLVPRQVLVQMRPVPRSLAESRLVLRELQKFGEVATFLNLKYDYRHNVQRQSRSVLAIFESDKSAADAIASSPLIINLLRAQRPATQRDQLQPHPLSAPSGGQPVADEPPSESDQRSVNQPESVPSKEPDQDRKMFCTIIPSGHHHHVHARENPYHRTFRISAHSLEVQDLAHQYGEGDEIRGGVPHIALADCFAGRKKTMPYRIQGRYMDTNEELGGNSPMRMWKVGQARREGRNADAQAILDQARERYKRDMESHWGLSPELIDKNPYREKSMSSEKDSDNLDAQLDLLVDGSREETAERKDV